MIREESEYLKQTNVVNKNELRAELKRLMMDTFFSPSDAKFGV